MRSIRTWIKLAQRKPQAGFRCTKSPWKNCQNDASFVLWWFFSFFLCHHLWLSVIIFVTSGLGFCKPIDLIAARDRSPYATCIAHLLHMDNVALLLIFLFVCWLFSWSIQLNIQLKGQSNGNHIVIIILIIVINYLIGCCSSLSGKWMFTKPALKFCPG